MPDLSTTLAVATFVGSGFAAFFGYLNWVYSTNRGRMEAEKEVNDRWQDFHFKSDSPRVHLNPVRIHLREKDDLLYRIRRTLFPLTSVEGRALVQFKSKYETPEAFEDTIRDENADGFWYRKTNVQLDGEEYDSYKNSNDMIYLIIDFEHPENIQGAMGQFYTDFTSELESDSKDAG